MLSSLNTITLAEAFSCGHQLISPNQRLATDLLARYLRSRDTPEIAFAPPVQTLSEWLDGWFSHLILAGVLPNAGHLLSEVQAATLWRQAVVADKEAVLLDADAAGRQAAAALRLIEHWRLDTPATHFDDPEWRAFGRWRNHFEQALDKLGLETPEQRMHTLSQVLQKPPAGDLWRAALPDGLVLAGFQELTPLESELLDGLAQTGVALFRVQERTPDRGHRRRLVFDDPETEIRRVVAWAGACHRSQPAQRIGVLINGMTEALPVLRRALVEHLGAPGPQCPYLLRGGARLADEPLVREALFLLEITLRWRRQPLSWREVSRLLLSRAVAGVIPVQAQVDRELRRWGRPRWTRYALIQAIERVSDGLADQPPLLDSLRRLDEVRGDSADDLLQILRLWGWPGHRRLRPAEVNTVQRFVRQLEQLRVTAAVLDSARTTGASISLMSLLQRQLEGVHLDVGGGWLSPIQVLAIGDAPGRQFDQTWLVNLTDHNWPPSPQPNPLLPSALRRALPRGHAEGELRYARHLLDDIKQNTATLWASHGRQQGDLLFQASPLIQDWPLQALEDFPRQLPEPASRWQDRMASWPPSDGLEWRQDLTGLPLTTRDREMPGGTALFGDQAWCPMAAYARWRLGAQELAVVEDYPGPLERGNLIHLALEVFWREYPDQSAAAAVHEAGELAETLRRIVGEQAAVMALAERFPLRLVGLEIERATTLLERWIARELQRPSFQVLLRERRQALTVGGVTTHITIDRVDRLSDGQCLVIDYKTGATVAARGGWFGPRLLQPQLALYVQQWERESPDQPVAGALMGRVHPQHLGFRGVVDDADRIGAGTGIAAWQNASRGNGVNEPESWQALKQQWREGVEDLAAEMVSGDCRNIVLDATALARSPVAPLLRRAEGAMNPSDGSMHDAELESDNE